MACFGGPSVLGLVVTAVPVFGFTGYLALNLQRSREQLACAGAKLLTFCYAAVWALTLLSSLKLLILLVSSSALAWSIVDALQAFVVLAVQGCVISILLHGYRSWAMQAMFKTVVVACCVSGADLACRLALLLAAGVSLATTRSCDDAPAPPPSVFSGSSVAYDSSTRGLLSYTLAHHSGDVSWSHHIQSAHHTLSHNAFQQEELGAEQAGATAQLQPRDWHVIRQGITFMAGGVLGVIQHVITWGLTWFSHPGGGEHVTSRQLLDSAGMSQGAGGSAFSQQTASHEAVMSGLGGAWDGPRFGSSCPDATWLKWGYLTVYATLLALTYGGLLLLPFTPLRDLLPARKALFRYLALCCATYSLGALGALLAGCGWTMGVCMRSLSHWLVDIGLGPLLHLTFLGNVLTSGSSAAEFDEDLLMYSEMRDAGVLDDDLPSDEPY